ncbi:A-kinase anchor protein SPHKAP isoform X2 [Electrophorus electricus]|uniref:A-kinase anchor protein SPHKAP isoform X2 n=1 Tax=Electrophorus electricus TaxID=8005 RepID=UPI0015D00C69|nr:A-kinase anchor protein SPHKAP isoform X2 [Electrophorus electricus]
MAGAKCLLRTPGNFQPSAMFEGSDSVDTEGVKTESSLGSSVSACKKVLCSNSVLDSSEYWMRNSKTLCRVDFLEAQHDRSCTICFVSLDTHAGDQHDNSCHKKLASVSPHLPRLVECLGMQPLKEQEILLLTGLDSPDTCQHDPVHTQSQRAADVCLVQTASGYHATQPNIILQINKFLIGLKSGQDRQHHSPLGGQCVADDDTNRSVSSIEEDFLTASEHLGDDSEDDPFRNATLNIPSYIRLKQHKVEEQPQAHLTTTYSHTASYAVDSVSGETAQHIQSHTMVDKEDSEDSETLCASSKSNKLSGVSSAPTRDSSTVIPKYNSQCISESAGHYATNLTESVLQDAFICLYQDEMSFTPKAAVSISGSPQKTVVMSQSMDEPPRVRTHSFELPRIVIVQSPDNCEAGEWTHPHRAAEYHGVHGHRMHDHRVHGHSFKPGTPPHTHHRSPIRNTSKPVELALACAASVIGTISTPHVIERLTLETGDGDDVDGEDEGEGNETERGEGNETEQRDYSFSSAVCGISQMAGALAIVDSADAEDSGEMFSASLGLLSVAQASTAVPLHCSVAEGISMDTFRANVAEVLLREASAVLIHKQSYTSIANFLETTNNKIMSGITRPKRSYKEHLEVDDFIWDVAESVVKHTLEKAVKRKELEGKDTSSIQGLLMESVGSLLFDVLCVTSRKINDISKCYPGSSDRTEGKVSSTVYEAGTKPDREGLRQLQHSIVSSHTDDSSNKQSSTEKFSSHMCMKENEARKMQDEREGECIGKESCRPTHSRTNIATDKEISDMQGPLGKCEWTWDWAENSPLHNARGRTGHEAEARHQASSSSTGALTVPKSDQFDCKTPVTCFAEDLATTVVSMATELAAICLENSSGKQPWFCALKRGSEVPEGLLLPCRTAVALHRKETQNGGGVAKKHRPPRLSEIKRKTEEQPELMERLVNRVVEETVNLDELATSDPFALFASEVTARIMNCPELNVVDMSKPGQPPRNRLQCERWSSRGKAASYESIPEEDPDLCGVANTLGPGSRLGQNLSRGSSISKQSSCESISDEFSRFMVNQMETEGRGFDLLLDYYAGKNASNILASAVQQAASRKNGHLNVRTSSCLSKQSSTESITEEFYRFMLRDMDKENKNCGIIKTKEWSNSLLPPIPRTPFCIRQSSVPDRRSSDSRLTVNSPIKANSFDGFARNSDSLNIYPSNCVSSTGLCKSDSCLYKRAHTDHITDMLIHETWASSIESLMRKNKIITEPSEDSMELDSIDTQPHVQLFANRLASEIVESGKSLLGGHQDGGVGKHQQHSTVGERRQGFKQSRPGNSHSRVIVELQEGSEGPPGSMYRGPAWRGQREVPLIHIEPDQRDERSEESAREGNRESHIQVQQPQRNGWRVMSRQTSDMTSTVPTVPSSGVEGEHRSFSTSSEESSSGSWAQVAPDEDPQEETTSSFIQLSEGNGNSSASSLGLADLEGFPEGPGSTVLISEERERNNQEQADEITSGLSTAGSSCQRELLVVNFDLEKECVDEELRAALQWIAASELGIPVLYYRKQEHTLANFQRVVHLAGERAWHVGDLFSLVAQFYQLHHNGQQAGVPTPSLFDWLLKTQH